VLLHSTWGNRKPVNFIFSHKRSMLFFQRTDKKLKTRSNHLVTNEPSLIRSQNNRLFVSHRTCRRGAQHPAVCYSQACSAFTRSVTMLVSRRCVKNVSCSLSSLEWKWVNSIIRISWTNVSFYIKHDFVFQQLSFMGATQFNTILYFHFFLSYSSSNPKLNPIDYKICGVL